MVGISSGISPLTWTTNARYLGRVVVFVLFTCMIVISLTQLQPLANSPAEGTLESSPKAQAVLLPCGDVCEYKGRRLDDRGTSFYPALQKNINCYNIMQRMSYKDHTIEYPPPKAPPAELRAEFEQFGDAPVNRTWYWVEFKPGEDDIVRSHNNKYITGLIEKSSRGLNVNTYKDDSCMMDVLVRYKEQITGQKALVIGTQIPWLEAILLGNGAADITTLEYGRLELDHPNMKVYSPYSFAEMYLEGNSPEFTFGASFSSIEHSGLGRYGDPLNPYGDLEAMAQVWCTIKPGGIFVLAVPGSSDDSSSILWNAHRVYGSKRIQHLISNWDLLEHVQCQDQFKHIIMVLRKPL